MANDPPGLASIILPIRDNLELTRTCVEALYRHAEREFELILVDNASSEDISGLATELDSSHPGVTYIRNARNEGFGFASNQGLAAATGEYLVLLNNDVVVTPGWLERLITLLDSADDIGLVGPRTNRASGPQVVRNASYDGIAGLDAYAEGFAREHAGEHRFLSRIVALCAVLNRDALDAVGGFDPCFWLGNFEDDDLCLRLIRKGFRIGMADDVFVHHEGSATWRKAKIDYSRLMAENWRWFCHKWEYRGPMNRPYPALRMAQAREFDAERDFLPIRFEDVFHPGAVPINLEGARRARLLLFADAVDRGWLDCLTAFADAYGADDPITLVVRVEPPLPDLVEPLIGMIQQALAAHPGSELPDILIETTVVKPRRRGGLYTAATALLLAEASRAPLYRREAEGCALPVVEEVTVESLVTRWPQRSRPVAAH